jgi:hypothetical protein
MLAYYVIYVHRSATNAQMNVNEIRRWTIANAALLNAEGVPRNAEP